MFKLTIWQIADADTNVLLFSVLLYCYLFSFLGGVNKDIFTVKNNSE